MNKQEIFELVQKYNLGQCTTEERTLLETWYLNENNLYHKELPESRMEEDLDDIYELLPKPDQPYKLWYRIAGTAAAIVAITIGIYFYTQQSRVMHEQITKQNDIAPGTNKAILILANGKKLLLSDHLNGALATQNGMKISKTADGQIIYQVEDSGKFPGGDPEDLNNLNIIKTPKGGQYQVILSDGTKVWLNAASTLKYPLSFSGSNDRKVELNGEAYFEVKKDNRHPFIVRSRQQDVIVLGTHFNINSYPDEAATKTTLLEGSVSVTNGITSKLLRPGQQSSVSGEILVTDVDVNQAVDWKNGNFYFEDENIESVMRKLARWYDIEVVYRGRIPDFGFGGVISRNKTLSEVLKDLEMNGIHFKIEGRRVIVMQ